MRRIRDQRLLDALERSDRAPYGGRVWRSVREGRDPLTCWRAGGRWDDGTFDVLYTSETSAAAVAERRFHLYQGQPLPPSKVRYELFELRVFLKTVVRFPDLDSLASIGFGVGSFGQLSYLQREREYPALAGDRRGVRVPGIRRSADPERPRDIFKQSDRVLRTGTARRHGSGRESRISHIPANVNHGPHRLGFRSNTCPHREMCCVMPQRGCRSGAARLALAAAAQRARRADRSVLVEARTARRMRSVLESGMPRNPRHLRATVRAPVSPGQARGGGRAGRCAAREPRPHLLARGRRHGGAARAVPARDGCPRPRRA